MLYEVITDGGLIRAKKLHIVYQEDENKPPEIIDPGLVGQVTQINPNIINTLSREGFIPIIAPVGTGDSGETYNINADLVASSIVITSYSIHYTKLYDSCFFNGADQLCLVHTINTSYFRYLFPKLSQLFGCHFFQGFFFGFLFLPSHASRSPFLNNG